MVQGDLFHQGFGAMTHVYLYVRVIFDTLSLVTEQNMTSTHLSLYLCVCVSLSLTFCLSVRLSFYITL